MNDMRVIIKQLESLIEGWATSGELAEIERELALDKLRRLYDAIRFAQPTSANVEPMSLQIDLDEVITLDPFAEVLSDTPQQTASEVTYSTSESDQAQDMMQVEMVATPRTYPGEEAAPDIAAIEAPSTTPVTTFVAAEIETSEELEDEGEQADAFEEIQLISTSPIEVTSTLTLERTPTPKSAPQPISGSLFGVEEKALHRHKQRVIRSLYDTEEPTKPIETVSSVPTTPSWQSTPEAEVTLQRVEATSTPYEEEPPQEEYIFEETSPASGTVLGEVMNPGVQTLSDSIGLQQHDSISEFCRMEPIDDLRYAIGINDKFLLIRDLFGGDGDVFEEAIATFNGFDDLDDCMIYIAENYRWNPNCDGAKLLMELLERKYA